MSVDPETVFKTVFKLGFMRKSFLIWKSLYIPGTNSCKASEQ